MYRCLGGVLSVALALWTATSAADDAYYLVPLDELDLIEGSLPTNEAPRDWSRWRLREHMSARVVLDVPGEAYVKYGEDHVSPVTPPGEREPVSRDRLAVRAPKGKPIKGTLFLPKSDWSEYATVRFRVAAAKADPKHETALLRMKQQHYQGLLDRNLPGGAWFRHQVREARKALGQEPGDPADQRQPAGRPRMRAFRNPEETFEVFTGGRALSENLQLDRGLRLGGDDKETVDVDSIEGITIREIDWKAQVEGKSPRLDPLAAKIPRDQHALFFPSFASLAQMLDQTGELGHLMYQMADPRTADAGSLARYQTQLGLSITGLTRLLGPQVARSAAFTGSDPYFPEGTDVALVLEATEPAILEQLLLTQIKANTKNARGVEKDRGEVAGVGYRGFRTPDRRVSSYVAAIDGAVVVTNSLHQIERLAAVAQGDEKSIASLDEYVFFRDRYRVGEEDETAFLFMSDAAIRRWCGPRWRIGASRRMRDAAVLAELQASQLERLARGDAKPGPIYTDLPLATGGEIRLTLDGVQSSTLGTLEFMTPIAEMSLDRVTKAEADAYARWRDGYQRNWQWAFDPIGVRLTIEKTRLGADMTVMPLIWRSQYRDFIQVARGVELAPDAGDPHGALGHFVMALNKDARPVRSAGDFVRSMTTGIKLDPLGWVGDHLAIYLDEDPLWEEVAQVEPNEREDFYQKNLYRLPLALHVDVSSGLKLTAFLTSFRAFVTQTAPDMTHWESLTYKDQPYVKITPTERARDDADALQRLAVYYAASGERLLVTLSEPLLKRAIDRELAREEARKKGQEPSEPDRPWLGKSLGLKVDLKLLKVLALTSRQEYQHAVQDRAWENLPILNEWKRRYPDQDPVELHARLWQTELRCPGGGKYAWNEKWQTMESTVYGHPAEPKEGPPAPAFLQALRSGDFGLTFEEQGLRARAMLKR